MVRRTQVASPTIGELIDQLWTKREEKRIVAAQFKILDAEEDALEKLVIAELDKLNIDGAKGAGASVSKTTSDIAVIEDWNKYVAWCVKTKNTQCIVRRANDLSWREQVTLLGGKTPPGTTLFSKPKLSLRSL